MIISDEFPREESRISSVCEDFQGSNDTDVDDNNIIDFASAKAELTQRALARSARVQSIVASLKDRKAERTTVIAESVIAFVLVLAVLISLLLGIISGF